MLTEAEKEKIKLEESLRYQVRTEIEKSNAKRIHSFLTFFNSNVGIFILSSIFLSFFSWAYSEYKTRREVTIKNKQEKTFLEYEIRQRLYMIGQLSDTISEGTKKEIIAAVEGGFAYAIRKDYEELPFSAILVEYQTLCETDVSRQVEQAVVALNEFEEYEDQLRVYQHSSLETFYYLPPRARKDFQTNFLAKLYVRE